MALSKDQRALVERAGTNYPEVYARVRGACGFGAINLDLHAARIVLAIFDRKRQQGLPLVPVAEGA